MKKKVKEYTIKIDRHNLFPHQMREISLIDFTSIPMNINNNDTSRIKKTRMCNFIKYIE